MTHRLARRILRDQLRRVSRAFARAFETNFPGARPPDHVSIQIRDGDDRVIKCRVNVRDAGMNVLGAFRLNNFRFLNVVRVQRKIFARSFNWSRFWLARLR